MRIMPKIISTKIKIMLENTKTLSSVLFKNILILFIILSLVLGGTTLQATASIGFNNTTTIVYPGTTMNFFGSPMYCPYPPYNTEFKFNNSWICASLGRVVSKSTVAKKTLFIGDSLSVGLYNQWRIDTRYESMVAQAGANVEDLYPILNNLNAEGYDAYHDKVIVSLGTNLYENTSINIDNNAFYIILLSVLAKKDFCVVVPPVFSSSSIQATRKSQFIDRLKYHGNRTGLLFGGDPKMNIMIMDDTGTSPDGGKHSFKKSTEIYRLGVLCQ